MKVKFVGAITGITGSCSWLKHIDSKSQWLVDCGMNQDKEAAVQNNLPFPFDPKEITGVFLTHAHIDHCGLIPKLYKEGFAGQVYCTEATAEISRIQLNSSVRHLANDLYEKKHIDAIRWKTIDTDERFSWGKPIPLKKNLSITLMRGSHMIGACGMQLSWKVSTSKWKSMLFTGDVGNNTEKHTQFPMLKGNHAAFPSVDYIMIESTYGAIKRENNHCFMETRHDVLSEIIDRTVNMKNGKVIIPAFAAQRAQDILLDIVLCLVKGSLHKQNGRPIRLLVHSPSIAMLNKIYADQLGKTFHGRKGEKRQYVNDMLLEILTPDELSDFIELLDTEVDADGQRRSYKEFGMGHILVSSDINEDIDDYDIILSSSGMAEGGYIVKHLDAFETDAKNTVLLTGYQAPDTRGGRMATKPESIKAEVVNLSTYYSAHADQTVLMDLVFDLGGYDQISKETIVFLNHGESTSKGSLREALLERNERTDLHQRRLGEVIMPNTEDGWYNLDRGHFEPKDTSDLQYEIQKLKKQLALKQA